MKSKFLKSNYTTLIAVFVLTMGSMILISQLTVYFLPIQYPNAKTVNQVDVYHGVSIKDPYRWLENQHSHDTRKLIKEENKVTEKFLNRINVRKEIKTRLKQLWRYPKHSVPFRVKNRLFYYQNTGRQDRDLFYSKNLTSNEEEIIIDPNKLSEDGTIALKGISVSEDSRYLAYSTSKAGSDWQNWRIKDLDTQKDLKDRLNWVKFSNVSWLKDSSGFFYSRYAKPQSGRTSKSPNYFQKLYFHKLGTKQKEDQLIYERKDHPDWGFNGDVTEDGRYLVINVWKGTANENRVFYKDLGKTGGKVIELLYKGDARYGFIENIDTKFYFFTDYHSPKGRIISIDINSFDPENPRFTEIVPEKKDTLVAASITGNHLFLRYLKDAYSSVSQYSTDGKFEKEMKFPGMGSVIGFGGRKEYGSTYYGYGSFNTPMEVYKLDIDSGEVSTVFIPKVRFNKNDYKTKQVFVKSKDGKKIPLFITYKDDIQLNGSNPTYLYGYGGFGFPQVPEFSVRMLTWMDMGGIYAHACLRGGTEYGEEWHKEGIKKNKQNVFDDFIACAEYLIDTKHTSKKKLAIAGESNGGLLVGACLNQRPDLFGAACPGVGVMDMLRYHKFTIGWGWISEYGNPENEDEFRALYAYSPLHNIQPGTKYPPTFITAADHDDRVVPAHSFKYAATLQKAQKGDAPILIRVETRAGHGKGKATFKVIDETADQFAFLAKVLEFEDVAKSNLDKATD